MADLNSPGRHARSSNRDDEFDLVQPLNSAVPAVFLAHSAVLLAQALLAEQQSPLSPARRQHEETVWPRRLEYWSSEVQGLTTSGQATIQNLCRHTCTLLLASHRSQTSVAQRCEQVQIAAQAVLELCGTGGLLTRHEELLKQRQKVLGAKS